MMITKWAYGLSTPLLILSGVVRLHTSRFVRSTVSISAIQYAVLLSIGYWAGKSYEQYAGYVEHVSIIVGLGLVLAGVFYVLVSRYARKKVLEEPL
jgi:membrane protein DedA with SNARE-associated domain